MAPEGCQANIWSNYDPILCRMYAPMLNVLTHIANDAWSEVSGVIIIITAAYVINVAPDKV